MEVGEKPVFWRKAIHLALVTITIIQEISDADLNNEVAKRWRTVRFNKCCSILTEEV